MDRKPYPKLEEGTSSLLKTSFLSACKHVSGRFVLCWGEQVAKWQADRRFTQQNKRSPLLKASYKNHPLQTEQNASSQLPTSLQPDPSNR
jgi:hypothetical protein